MSPWLSGKSSQSFGCFAFTSIITCGHIWVLWGAAGIHKILRETSKLLAEFFMWGVYLRVTDLITRSLHALVRPSCTWITPKFTRFNHIHLNTDPFPPPLPSSPVELGNSQTMSLNHRTRRSKVMDLVCGIFMVKILRTENSRVPIWENKKMKIPNMEKRNKLRLKYRKAYQKGLI